MTVLELLLIQIPLWAHNAAKKIVNGKLMAPLSDTEAYAVRFMADCETVEAGCPNDEVQFNMKYPSEITVKDGRFNVVEFKPENVEGEF